MNLIEDLAEARSQEFRALVRVCAAINALLTEVCKEGLRPAEPGLPDYVKWSPSEALYALEHARTHVYVAAEKPSDGPWCYEEYVSPHGYRVFIRPDEDGFVQNAQRVVIVPPAPSA